VKIGQKDGQVYVEAHPDVYRKIPDYDQYAADKLAKYPLANQVDVNKFRMAINLQNGVPTNVTRISTGNRSQKLVEFSQE
jgi:L,D-transpeptidase ErfK/SrfK